MKYYLLHALFNITLLFTLTIISPLAAEEPALNKSSGKSDNLVSKKSLYRDMLVLKNGQSIYGKILNYTTGARAGYKMETEDKITFSLDLDNILYIVRAGSNSEKYHHMRGKMEDTLNGNLSMYQWCSENKLPASYGNLHLRRIIELDPEHELARAKLGYVKRADGQWRTRQEEMAFQGKVPLPDGRYTTPQQRDVIASKKNTEKMEREQAKLIQNCLRFFGTGKHDKAVMDLNAITLPEAVPALTKALENEKRYEVQKLLINALTRIGSDEALGIILRCAVDHPNSDIRFTCAEILAREPRKVYSDYLVLRLSPTKSTNTQINSAGMALGILKDTTAVPALIKALYTRHEFIITSGNTSNQTSVGFSSDGSSGFSTGGSVRKISRDYQNPGVLEALEHITGVNYEYNKQEWIRWYQNQKHIKPQSLRRE